MKCNLLKCTLLSSLLFAGRVQAEVLHYFGQTTNSYQSQTAYGNNANGQYAQTDDGKIYFEVYGKGKPIVVLHGGIVGSPAEMAEIIDHLIPTRQVIVINTRGQGKSETGKGELSYARKAKDIQIILKQLGIEKADLLGFSDGAYTAYQFAASYPQLTDKVIAIGAGEWQKGSRQFTTKLTDYEKLDPLFWQQQAKLRPDNAHTAQWLDKAQQYYNQLEFGNEIFHQIKSPVLVMAGELDKNAPLNTVLQAYKNIAHAQLAIIPNTEHATFLQNSPAVWACIQPFLDEN